MSNHVDVDNEVESTSDHELDKSNNTSSEEIEQLLRLSGIEPSEVAPIVQSLYTTISLDENCGYRVIELDQHLLETLSIGDSLSFRGDENEPAVLCTATRTYEVKEAETSNTCIVVEGMKLKDDAFVEGCAERIVEKVEVKANYNTYFELKECSPRLSKLQIILEPSSFKGLEYEKSIDPDSLYDWERIQSEIQASDGEIKAALPDYLVVHYNGFYRLIAFEFEARALPLMLDLIEENSWEVDGIDKEISCESLEDIIPEPIFDILFKKYSRPSTKVKEDGTQLYEYDKPKCSRLLAQILLTACPSNNYNDFMEAWKIGSPECIPPKEEYLYGTAIVRWNSQTMRKEVTLYPEMNLPDNINQRLNELFKAKEKWTVPEITPYISKFTSRKQDVNAILTKYARPSTVNNVKYYSAKHGK
ncbi:hypothetical protein QAD02_004467 [Eretmocerus hayati]|uniref:Uncharacterized protein n=1 Tax=Eretmocerus hayati TaxID=131215 RepID=A0ACC2NPT7_9HYME|nr:hypothetical protein QAD02_004467 [Eretmocerus hayati]